MALRIIAHKQQNSAGDEQSTLNLKLMGSRVNQSPKQRVPVPPPPKWTSVQRKFKKKSIIRFVCEIIMHHFETNPGETEGNGQLEETFIIANKLIHIGMGI